MFQKFGKHIKTKAYFKNGDSILIAVSGGVDSMVLCHLMIQAGFTFSVAHVDHTTRNGESKNDALFVQRYCTENNITYYLKTISYKSEYGNFHNWAHNERYVFFDSLNYDKIITAHHADDQSETILINALNGRSLDKIPDINGSYIRPLLPFTKNEIREEAKKSGISFVIDKSNATDAYLRNFLRNTVFGKLKDMVPDYDIKLLNLSNRLEEDALLIKEIAEAKLPFTEVKGRQQISLSHVLTSSPLLLYHRLHPIGINRSQATDIFNSQHQVGATFTTSSHTLLIDRESLIISRSFEHASKTIEISISDLPKEIKYGDYNIHFSQSAEIGAFKYNTAFFPLEKLKSTVSIRGWQFGDTMKPFGMKGKTQSVKKIFVDHKVNKLDKTCIPILTNQSNIMWVMGLRTSEEYRCHNEGRFLKVEFSKE